MRKAAIDVGSNSVLLLVAERANEDWRAVYETSEVTALGEDVRSSGALKGENMERTLCALRQAFADAERFGAEARAFGTMALRIAGNAAEFLEMAAKQGTPVEVISGELEAELGLLSVVEDPRFRNSPAITIVDVGGHSTEIATWTAGEAVIRNSFPVGTLWLRGGSLEHERIETPELLSASAEIDDIFGQRYRENVTGIVVALGATGTNLVTIRDAIVDWEPEKVHGQYLDFEEVSRFVERTMRMNDAGRAAMPGIEKGREKTIHIGALILERALQMVHALGCYVSVRGWRYAILSRV